MRDLINVVAVAVLGRLARADALVRVFFFFTCFTVFETLLALFATMRGTQPALCFVLFFFVEGGGKWGGGEKRFLGHTNLFVFRPLGFCLGDVGWRSTTRPPPPPTTPRTRKRRGARRRECFTGVFLHILMPVIPVDYDVQKKRKRLFGVVRYLLLPRVFLSLMYVHVASCPPPHSIYRTYYFLAYIRVLYTVLGDAVFSSGNAGSFIVIYLMSCDGKLDKKCAPMSCGSRWIASASQTRQRQAYNIYLHGVSTLFIIIDVLACLLLF